MVGVIGELGGGVGLILRLARKFEGRTAHST